MATLLAWTGLALGQAPEYVVQGEPVEVQRPLFRGLLRPVSTTTTMQAQPMPSPAPAPGPVQGVAPTNGDLTAPPTALNGNGVNGADCWRDPTDRFWISGEYLLWRFGSVPLPDFNANVSAGNAIVFSRNASVTPGAAATITDTTLNVPVSVTVNTGLPGGKSPDLRDQPGYRIFAGAWFNPEQTFGMEGSFFWIWTRDVGFTNQVNLAGQTVQLSQVQTLTVTGAAGAVGGTTQASTVTSPLFLAADVNNSVIGKATNGIWGLELNGRSRVAYFGPVILEVLAGARFIQINQESADLQNIILSPTVGAGQGTITFAQQNNPAPPPATIGQTITIAPNPGTTGGNPNLFPSTATLLGTFTATINDDVRLHNDYYLAQLGGSFDWKVTPRFSVLGFGKLGIGGVRERAVLTGVQTTSFTPGSNIAPPGQPVVIPGVGAGTTVGVPPFPTNINGGLIVAPADNGQVRELDRVAFVPEGMLALSFQATPCWRLWAGYDLIFFSTVAKIGNVVTQAQTTTAINFGPQNITNTVVNPGFRFGGQQATLQGLNLGMEFRY
jgi:hypothetical protein